MPTFEEMEQWAQGASPVFTCEERRCLAKNSVAIERVRSLNAVINEGAKLAGIDEQLLSSTTFDFASLHLYCRVVKSAVPYISAAEAARREYTVLASLADRPSDITQDSVKEVLATTAGLTFIQEVVRVLKSKPVKSSNKKWYIIGSAGVLAIAVAGYGIYRWKKGR